jgi:hypothetical protein
MMHPLDERDSTLIQAQEARLKEKGQSGRGKKGKPARLKDRNMFQYFSSYLFPSYPFPPSSTI